MSKRFAAGMLSTLLFAYISSAESEIKRGRNVGKVIGVWLLLLSACAPNPVLTVGPDGRGCMVGIVDSTDAAILRTKNPAVHAGDILFTPFCAEQVGIDLHNEIYELTR